MGHNKEADACVRDSSEAHTAGGNHGEAYEYVGDCGEFDRAMGDSGEADVDGNEIRNNCNNEEIKELFDVKRLTKKDDKEFKFAKQKLNSYVRRKKRIQLRTHKLVVRLMLLEGMMMCKLKKIIWIRSLTLQKRVAI